MRSNRVFKRQSSHELEKSRPFIKTLTMATANKGPLVGTIRNLMDEHAGEDFGIPVESPSEAPKKTRPTIFTSLVSASFISPEAIKRKKYLEKYFTIRVEPQVIRLLDYAPGETIIASATIKNYSKRAKRITLHPPADSRLSLHQDTDWSTILISPGLEKVVKVVLKVPEDHSDRAASVITDQIIVDIDDGKRVVIPFEAFPASPKIEMQSSLDFGFLIQEALNSKDGKDLNIASREVTVVNKGKRGGSFSWTVDSNSPIKVFPQKFHIDAFNPSKNPEQYSKTVRVEFRPENLGIFKTDIQLVTDSMIPSFKTRGESSANDKYQLSISANVFKHKLRLKYPDGFREVNLDDVNFGPVYCFQTSKMDVCLENRSPETLHWVLCHAQESSPLVPRSVDLPDIFDSKASNKKSEIDDDRTALIAEPSEGVIGPFQSIKIGLIFTPETALASLGFKANVLDAPIKSYAIPMLLKTVHKSRKNQLTSGYAGESPISITVRAKACPLKALTSTHIIDFHNALADELVKSDLLLKNDSDLLGYSFKFRKIAHIDLHPNQGIVSPRGSFKIEVSFKPRQLGNFQFPLLCDIFEYDAFNMHDNVKALEPIPSLNGRYFFKEETFRVPPIKTLKLKVNGNCLPRHCTTKITGIPNVKSSHFMDDSFLKQKGHEQMPVNPEWEEKSHHRHKYVEFLRQQRIERSERRHAEFFGDAIDSGVSKAGLRQVDRDNGLKLPECRSSFGMMPQELKSAAEQESEIVNNRRLRQLFSKLKDPELYKSAHEGRSVLDTGDMSIDTPLTTADLSKIYASTEILDFGLVTIHSSNVQFINFMNATRSVSPVHIEIQFSKDSGTSGENVDDITIVPSKLFLSSMSVQGVAVTFKGHRSDKFSYRLTYTINGRYRYSIPVTVRTILPNLELSVHDVNLLAHSEPHTGKETIQSPGYSDLGTNRRRSSWEDFLIRKRRPSTLESISVAESITIRNTGNYPCSFSWDDTENTASSVDENAERLSRLGISYEGRFDINPLNGVIEAHGSAKITVSYTPGIKPRLDKEFHCRIIDAFDKKTLIKEEVLKCKGQVPVGNCHVVGLMRNSQLDLGIVPIIPLDMSASNNLLSNEISLLPKILSGRYSSCGYRTVKLKNSSPNPCSYFVTSASKVGKVVISPDSGVIKGNCTSHEISFVVIPNKPGPHDDSLLIHIIGGGRVIRIPIHYEAYPVKVVATLLETGGAPKVFLGSEVTRKIQVTNKGSSLVRCVLDLREHQDIDCQLEISELVRSALKVKRDKLKMQKQATNKDTSAEFDRLLKIDSGNELYHFDRDQKDHSNISLPLQGILYVFDILPGETIVLTATFKPTKIQKVGNVSLSFLGTGTEPVLLPLCLESVPSPVSISRTELNFKNKVVYKNFGIGNLVTSTKGSTSVKNETTHSMDWYLDLNPLDSMISSSIFRFEPSGGVLLPGQTQIVNVSFMPDDLGLYRIKAPLVLEYEDSRTRLDLAVSGTGVDPCLAFEPPEIFLPILPTGEFAIVSFYVINYGCERAELQSILPDELTSQFVHFELSFPEGRTLKSDGERLKIHLEYSATSQATERRCSGPISFSTKIEFVDTIGRPFFLSVNGTSDNSYFTLSPYIWQRRRDRAFVFNDSSLTFASSQIAGEVKRYTFVFHRFPFFKSDRDRIPIFITPAGIVLYESSDVVAAETYFRGIGFSISRWFDQYIGFDTGIDFPESIIESNGRAVINLLTGLTGRSVTGLPVSGLGLLYLQALSKQVIFMRFLYVATKPEDRYKYAYKQNVEVINYLKGFGLLLCTVKPEFLLSESDFVRFVENHFEKLVCKLTCTTAFPFLTTCKKKKEKGISVAEHHKEYYKGIRQRFRIVSMEAWTTVFLQIMKKFAFSGINTKHFKSLPAVVEDATLASVPSIKSPIYGLPESVLLRWASYHVSKVIIIPIVF